MNGLGKLVPSLLLAACAPSQIDLNSYVSQQFPQVGAVESAVVVAEPHDIVWERLVARLSRSSFFITQIARDSHLITLEFTAPMPGKYLDCGTARAAYVDEADTTQTDIMLAEGGHIQWGVRARKHTGVEVEARGDLSYRAYLVGGANIYAASVSGGTGVQVNARYVLGIEQDGEVDSRLPVGLRDAYVFTTHGQEMYSTSNPVIRSLRCTPTGVLESLLLDMAR